MEDIFGTESYEPIKTNFVKFFKVKPGDNIYRILPPMFSQKQAKRWSAFYRIHYGYTVPNTKTPDKPFHKPFLCVQVTDKDKNILQECALCNKINEQTARRDSKKMELENKKASAEAIKTALEPLVLWIKTYNLEKKFHMNAVNTDMELGRLKVGYKTYQQIETLFKDYNNSTKKYALDPKAGVWINIRRNGDGWKVPDTVSIVREAFTMPDGGIAERIKTGPISDDLAKLANETLKDLKDPLVVSITPEQIKMLVDSSGDPEEVASIFALAQKKSDDGVDEIPFEDSEDPAPPSGLMNAEAFAKKFRK